MNKTYPHEGALMDCGACHNVPATGGHPEKTEFPHRLRAPVNVTCLECHDAATLNLAGGHVVSKHPVYRKRDPMWITGNPYIPEREFNCVSCHNPHSSNQPRLFRYNYGPTSPYKGELCAVCHWQMFYGSESDAPFPPQE